MPRKGSGGGYYAINQGRSTGVVNSWSECEGLVKGYSGANFKRFDTYQEAQSFARGGSSSSGGSGYGGSGSSASSRSSGGGGSSYGRSSGGYSSDRPVVYTDGACSGNGRSGARAGIGVYWGDGDSRNVSEPLAGRPTNNRAEIGAAARAVQQAKDQGYNKLEVRTDSDFLVKSSTKWIPGWERNNWTTASGDPVVNKEDFKDLLRASEGMDVTYKHVDGHAGIHGNEQADRLAKSGMYEGNNGGY